MARGLKQTLKEYLRQAGTIRWLRVSMAFLVLTGLFVPTLIWINDIKAYSLSPETQKVLGVANRNLSAKFSFDEKDKKWQFNKNGVASLANSIAKHDKSQNAEEVSGALSQLMAKQVGGAGKNDQSLYSVDLPVKATEGITYYDNVTRLSFKMIPTFSSRDGKLVQDRIVYPFAGGGQVVYTAKSNGLKEDIVLSKYIGDTLRYSYKLELPETLEARVLEDGSIGVYSGNPALFGNISFSSDEDKARVMDGRKNSSKDNLVFGIPAPFIKDQTGEVGHTRYELDGKNLTVVAEGLKGLSYPLTVDPSVTVTSTSDFETDGNNESNIEFGTDEIKRGALSGGSLGSWGTQTAMTGGCDELASGVNNGYVYCVGGTTVRYAKLSTTGTITGSWQTGTSLATSRVKRAGFVYNGYLYVTGGDSGSGTAITDVLYIKLNSDGTTAGSWQTGASLSVARFAHAAFAYNGYAYAVSGKTGSSTYTNTIDYAPIRANGSLGTWATTTNAPGTGRFEHAATIYNGFMYVMGGENGGGALTDTNYIAINSDGTLGSTWTSSTALSANSNRRGTAIAHKGHMYVLGGWSGSACAVVTRYAPIHANGSLGTWNTTTNLTTATCYPLVAQYRDYIFSFAGEDATGANLTNVYSAKIDSAGSIGPSVSTTAFDVETSGRSGHATVAAYGYIYVLGGDIEGSSTSNTVKFASIGADGSVGAWSNGNSFSEQRYGAEAIVRGNYLYLIGGLNHVGTANCPNVGSGADYCSNIEWASINTSTGALTWQGSTFTYSSQGRAHLGVAILNDYLYVLGGVYNNNSTSSTEVNYAQFNADGSLGSFSATTTPMQTARANLGAFAHNGRIYAVGSRSGHASEYATPDSNGNITTSWTSTGSVPSSNADRYLTIVYSKGYVYSTGGFSVAAAYATEIQVAKVNSDGTMSSWSTSSHALSSARARHSSVIYNDKLYVLGGEQSLINAVALVSYHQISNGHSGTTGSWTSHASMTGRAAHATVAYNGYIYALGGCSAVATSVNSCANASILSTWTHASVSSTGVVGTWSTPASLPTSTPRFGLSAVAYNGYLYVSGGCSATSTNDCTSFLDTVYYAPISSSDGSLGAWSAGGTSATGRFGHSMVANNGYLYVLGGCSAMSSSACTAFQSDVQYSQIGSSGLPGSWASAGSSFTTGRFYQSAVVNNNNLYVLGGCSAASGTNCTTVRGDIQRRPLNTSNGTLSGSWTVAGAIPTARYGATAEAYNGSLYVIGGCSANSGGSCSSYLADVEYVPFTASGLGDRGWSKSATDFTSPRLLHGTAIVNGYLVLAGGNASGTFLSESRTSPISVIDRLSQYSKLLAVSPTTDVAGVYYNGSLDGGSSVTYRVAPSSGIFGATNTATQGSGSEPTPLCGSGDIYYVQVMVTMGDRTNAVFADDSISNLTDITIYYRLNAIPPPNLRLNGGKWFYNDTQQPLDICRQ